MGTAKPFKGLDSYRGEDRHNFYGREGDAERLISRVLSSRFTLLHARSGAGKTSLIQAKVAPDLEKSGWTAVVTRPERDPLRAVRYEVLKSLVPPPDVERQALLRACSTLFPGSASGTLTLHSLITRYQQLQHDLESADTRNENVNETLKRLLSEVQYPRPSDAGAEGVAYYAVFLRVLSGGLRSGDYLRHLAALSDGPQAPASPASADATSVDDILALLAAADAGLYQGLMSSLDAPAESLVLFLRRLFAVYGRWRPGLRLVLVFDQFEELFTQFGHVDDDIETLAYVGGVPLASYQLRDQFIDDLSELYFALFPRVEREDDTADPADAGAAPARATRREADAPLPVCCVVSIRQEFVADLDAIRQFVDDLDQWSFHLDRLLPAAAERVLRKATEKTPRPFDAALIRTIVSDLTHEERFVEPAELQVVVYRIWEEPELPAAGLAKLGGAKQILDLFLAEFLDNVRLESQEKSDRDKVRIELLEILQALVSARGKNPTPIPALIGAPFRLKERRQALVRLLEEGRLIRIEAKEGTSIAEIRHDFLIRRILRTVRTELIENTEHGRFVSALAVLGLCLRTQRLLTWREFEDLARNEGNIEWMEHSVDGVPLRWTPAELMVRSVLQFQDPLPELRIEIPASPGPRPVLADYIRRFAQRLKRPPTLLRVESIPHDWRGAMLDHAQLTTLNVDPESWRLSRDQLLVVTRSHLEWCGDGSRHLVEYWAKRWKNEETSRV